MKNKSFTLIELLVVIVIIGVLAGVIMVTTTSSISNATLARAKAFSSNVQNSMLLNLVSEWTFDDPTQPLEDNWGVNDGILHGSPVYKNSSSGECIFGGCYDFNGNYIELGMSSNFGTDIDKEFTLNVWIKPREQKDYLEILGRGWSSSGSFSLYIGSSSIRLATKNDSGSRIDATYQKNLELYSWHNVVAIYDSSGGNSNVRLYFDGQQSAQNTQTGLLNYNTYILLGNTFNGLIDDTRIYNTALSSAQIRQNYIAGLNTMLASGNISNEEYNQRINNLATK